VDDGLDAVEGPPHDRAVRDRADHVGLRRVENVEADDLLAGVGQDANERVAEVARAAGHEDAHRRRGSRRALKAIDDDDERFERGLRRVLDGIAAEVGEPA